MRSVLQRRHRNRDAGVDCSDFAQRHGAAVRPDQPDRQRRHRLAERQAQHRRRRRNHRAIRRLGLDQRGMRQSRGRLQHDCKRDRGGDQCGEEPAHDGVPTASATA
jgi:hypothetical protein